MPHPMLDIIDKSADEIVTLQQALVSLPALGPTNDGEGERDKVNVLATYLKQFRGVSCQEIQAPDDRVYCGHRPSLIARRPGRSPQTLWLIAHTDVVPTGDLSLWRTNPFELNQQGDLLYGRGVEDNHQGLVSALILLRALELTGSTTDLSLGILLAADEETGNALGIEYIMRNHPEIFDPQDLVLIPDFGTKDGAGIEIAEKSVLWLKFTLLGRQCHASTPAQGLNTLCAAATLILELEKLNTIFDASDPLFNPPQSTFVPTKKEANVPNINTIPGQDVFYLDCRVLPSYPLQQIEDEIRRICDTVQKLRGVTITFSSEVREQAAASTPPDSPVVCRLAQALKAERGLTPQLIGIGGGTVASSFRKRGLPAACWSTLLNTAHQPNEHSSIANTIADARVFARLLFHEAEVR